MWLRGAISEYTAIPAEAIAFDARFRELGLTSLHIAALTSRLSGKIGRTIQPTAAWQYPTPRALARYAFSVISTNQPASGEEKSSPDA
jgi:acyl carrier protein